MTLEDHLRRMIGDLVLTAARLAADNDTLAEKLKQAESLPPLPKTPDNGAGVVP